MNSSTGEGVYVERKLIPRKTCSSRNFGTQLIQADVGYCEKSRNLLLYAHSENRQTHHSFRKRPSQDHILRFQFYSYIQILGRYVSCYSFIYF
jgi:hypothetical protein